jgi:hypothetical protein
MRSLEKASPWNDAKNKRIQYQKNKVLEAGAKVIYDDFCACLFFNSKTIINPASENSAGGLS